ncbi:unnamed protein product [Owenia fusiformis]|uniref:Uncharacterized protein n=1 Tax=Owenia fusiformis TaxID=6347 RepID=A0A8J1YBH6_OWEFU|nr:unnamed protein product [Owenia fusiformis]
MQWNHIMVMALIVIAVMTIETEAVYSFKRYTYKKKAKYTKKFKAAQSRCEASGQCNGLEGLQSTICLRRCMSEDCYQELYGHDELEEGEIDVQHFLEKKIKMDDQPG